MLAGLAADISEGWLPLMSALLPSDLFRPDGPSGDVRGIRNWLRRMTPSMSMSFSSGPVSSPMKVQLSSSASSSRSSEPDVAARSAAAAFLPAFVSMRDLAYSMSR